MNAVCVCVFMLATWYSELGQRHAASWHGMTPHLIPEVVTMQHYGIAAPRSYPFGTRLKVTRMRGLVGGPSPYDGRSVIVTVVDRVGRPSCDCHFDLWPAAARVLGIGPTFGKRDAGALEVRVERVEDNDCFRWRL